MTRPAPAADSTPPAQDPRTASRAGLAAQAPMPREVGGPRGLEPTRYGDWERNGRCSDF